MSAYREMGMPIEILLVEDNPGDVRLTQEALRARETLAGGDEHPEPGRVAGELESLKAAESDLLRRQSAARVAADMLREALRDYQEDHLERLSGRAGRLFESLSLGSYRELRFGANLDPEVRGDGLGPTIRGPW